ncbi:MAG: hypothetical protein H0U82_05370 [Actinobacteria bacterium]|nr:hypothetical protein [Actinomycetota bacterium]
MSIDALPEEAEKLLAVPPDEFVSRRAGLVRELRDAGRAEEAATLAGLRKPSVVVFAVNRAARARPKAARAAADAALRVKETQLGSEPDAFKKAVSELEDALDLLAEVAVTHVAPREKTASDAMRRRVRDLLRSAVAADDARQALVRGALTEELEAVGFSPFAGMVAAPVKGVRRKSGPSRAVQQEAKRRERVRALRDELAEAERQLEEAVQAQRTAERERASAERAVSALRAKLERLD